MNIALFTETPVQDFYDGSVTRQAERRIFNIPNEDLCAGSVKNHVDAAITMYCPGRLMLDPTVSESSPGEQGEGRLVLRRWVEFSGSVRLLMLRPRQYFTSPPRVVRIQPPSRGSAGRLIIEQVVPTTKEFQELAKYADEQFRMIKEYVLWVNEDLDFYEQAARNWLWTLVQTKKKRLCTEDALDQEDMRDFVGGFAPGSEN